MTLAREEHRLRAGLPELTCGVMVGHLGCVYMSQDGSRRADAVPGCAGDEDVHASELNHVLA